MLSQKASHLLPAFVFLCFRGGVQEEPQNGEAPRAQTNNSESHLKPTEPTQIFVKWRERK